MFYLGICIFILFPFFQSVLSSFSFSFSLFFYLILLSPSNFPPFFTTTYITLLLHLYPYYRSCSSSSPVLGHSTLHSCSFLLPRTQLPSFSRYLNTFSLSSFPLAAPPLSIPSPHSVPSSSLLLVYSPSLSFFLLISFPVPLGLGGRI